MNVWCINVLVTCVFYTVSSPCFDLGLVLCRVCVAFTLNLCLLGFTHNSRTKLYKPCRRRFVPFVLPTQKIYVNFLRLKNCVGTLRSTGSACSAFRLLLVSFVRFLLSLTSKSDPSKEFSHNRGTFAIHSFIHVSKSTLVFREHTESISHLGNL